MEQKRLLIYYAKDSENELEGYSDFFINRILFRYTDIILVSGKQELKVLSENIKEKLCKNIYDINIQSLMGAYRMGLECVGIDELKEYSEIACISDNMMGPVADAAKVFLYMDGIDCDFWGIAKQNPTPLNYLDYTGENLQEEYILPDFISFRSDRIDLEQLLSIFVKADAIDSFRQSLIDAKALYLTTELKKMGYTYSTYIDTDEITRIYYNPLLFIPAELISKKNCPFFLKESFIGDYDNIISNTSGQAARELYEFLSAMTEYDMNMLWDTILKHGHQQDINHNMHLNYIINEEKYDEDKLSCILEEKKVVLIMHLYFPDLLEKSLEYAKSMPSASDIFITTDTEEKKKEIETVFSKLECNKLEVRLIENRGRDVSSLLTGVKDIIMNYDYACFVHDKKSAQIAPGSIGRDFGYQCLENTLGTKAYVGNVICQFYDQERLGMLSPLYPVHGTYFPVHGGYDWGNNYENTKQLIEQLGLTIPVSKEKSPVAPLGTMFWFRPAALKPLFDCNWQYSDFPQEPNGVDGTLLHAIERAYSFVVQQQGYYPAMMCNEKFAQITITNMADFLQGINRVLEKHQPYNSYQQAIDLVARLEYEYNDLIRKTSLKWQIKDRIKRFFHIN